MTANNKTPINKEKDTINKSILLNWLYSADKDLLIEDLGLWLELRTGGKYVLVKEEQKDDSLLVTESINNLNNGTHNN